MSAIEERVLSEIYNSYALSKALSAGLETRHFKDPDIRAIFEYTMQHFHNRDTHGELPLRESILERWPTFRFHPPLAEDQGKINTLVVALRKGCLDSDNRSFVSFLSEIVDDLEPEEFLNEMRTHVSQLDFRHSNSRAFGVGEIASGAKEIYNGAKSGSLYGIPWPWDCLTSDTMGKKGGDFIVFYGRMKSMKTWLMLYSAVIDYMLYNQRVLIWSREMTPDKIKPRIASILAGVDYQLFKAGNLPPAIEKKALKQLDKLDLLLNLEEGSESAMMRRGELGQGKNRADLIVLSGRNAPKTLSGFEENLKKFNVDIGYADSFYHMQKDGLSEKVSYWYKIQCLSEGLKDIAMNQEVPIVGVAQANREGEKSLGANMAEVAGGDSIAREADLVMRIIKKRSREEWRAGYEAGPGRKPEPETSRPKSGRQLGTRRPQKKVTPDGGEIVGKALQVRKDGSAPAVGAEVAIIIPGNREGVLEGFTMHAVPGYHFEVTQASMNSTEVRKWVNIDGDQPSSGKKSGVPTRDSVSIPKITGFSPQR